MELLTKEEARESVQRLVNYLKQQIVHTNLDKEDGSRAHRFITQFFNDFKASKKQIDVLANHIADDAANYFGTTTKKEMIKIADVFDYTVTFSPATLADLKAGRTKVSGKWTRAIFIKK